MLFDAEVSECGTKPSGVGQQYLALTRVVFKNSRIPVFDEPISKSDSESVHLTEDAMEYDEQFAYVQDSTDNLKMRISCVSQLKGRDATVIYNNLASDCPIFYKSSNTLKTCPKLH